MTFLLRARPIEPLYQSTRAYLALLAMLGISVDRKVLDYGLEVSATLDCRMLGALILDMTVLDEPRIGPTIVHPDYENCGIESALRANALEFLLAAGCRWVELHR